MKSQRIYAISAVVCLTLLTCSFALAGESEGPFVGGAVTHTLSRPMREYAPVRAEIATRLSFPAITTQLNFDGQKAPQGQLYSDATGAVGTTQYLQLVNSQYTIYDKGTGAVIAGPIAENALWATTGDSCQTSNNGDGTVMYDQLANVWVLQHKAIPTGGPYLNCFAVSTSSDATGTYNLYDFPLTLQLPDKPRIGLWPDAYYVSQDLLDPTTKDFVRSMSCALNRTMMLAGTNKPGDMYVCFQGSISLPTFVTSTLDGQTQPPVGEPAFFWQLDQRPSVGKNNLNSFLFHVDWVTPTNSTFTGPVANALPSYTDACNSFKPCVPEPSTTNLLQAWGDRLIGRVTYRNFGTYESVVMTHAVTQGIGTAAHSAVRWYEYRTPLTPVIYQSGTYSPDTTTWRWIPNIAQDQFGDIAVGYNVSGSTVDPGLRYAGRLPTAHLGSLGAEITVISGAGVQNATNKSWSSFGGMAIDPVDDCTFWMTGEYYATSSLEGWSTRIASFRFPSCTN
jgi:hypothetical protein